MSTNIVFQVFVPTETYDQLKAICKRTGWTHSILLGVLIDQCPAIEMRTATPPLHIKKSDSPRLFKANIDAYTHRRINYTCDYRDWSHRDMMIHLTKHYMENHNG